MNHYFIQIAANGRMVLPVALRERLHVQTGGQVVVRSEQGKLMLESVDDAVARAQALVRRYVPKSDGIVDELLAERRAEAARE